MTFNPPFKSSPQYTLPLCCNQSKLSVWWHHPGCCDSSAVA